MDEFLHLGWDGHVWFGIITGGFMLGVYIIYLREAGSGSR
jgi:hypothetical protein